MLTDLDQETLDKALDISSRDGRVLVWEDDGVIWIQCDDDEPQYLASPHEATLAYLLCGAVGEPD